MQCSSIMLGVCLLLVGGCQLGDPPIPEQIPAMPEDLSTWTLPELVQPEGHSHAIDIKPRPITAAEKVFEYQPGGVYKITVALDAPLDIILEPGEKVQTVIGTDPKPITQGAEGEQQNKQRWEYKQGTHGVGETASTHIFVRALEAGATLGLTVTTSVRTYYLTCVSTTKSPIRAVWWKYPTDAHDTAVAQRSPSILPDPRETKLWHVGYVTQASHPDISFMPRHILDDGRKLYIIYPEVTLFGTVPMVRAVGVNGFQVVNSRQILNVVILDTLVPKVELRVGTGEQAETVAITRGALRTIQCPGDPACPHWPAAAQALAGRTR